MIIETLKKREFIDENKCFESLLNDFNEKCLEFYDIFSQIEKFVTDYDLDFYIENNQKYDLFFDILCDILNIQLEFDSKTILESLINPKLKKEFKFGLEFEDILIREYIIRFDGNKYLKYNTK